CPSRKGWPGASRGPGCPPYQGVSIGIWLRGQNKIEIELFPRQPAQRISDDNILPAQGRDRQVIALGQIASSQIRRQQLIRRGRPVQERLRYMAGAAGGAFVDVVGGQRLR